MDFFNYLKNNKLMAIFISFLINILLLISFLIILYFYLNYNCPICENEITTLEKEAEKNDNITNSFYVEVKGAVKKPGVYQVTNQNIINDLIALAGGFNKNAYTKNINLSKHLFSELVVYVYTKTEYQNFNKKEEVKEIICECPTYDITNCTNEMASEIINDDQIDFQVNNSSTNNLENEIKKININISSKEELISLPGIGESKALDIINYRETTGHFKNIEEIKNVSGIGNALYEKIKDLITV